VQPLVDELNALLTDREDAVRRALATAGDLAHGLKTPLALLAQEAERAEALGNREMAATLDEQVDRMSRQVNYHLARARAAASSARGAARCNVAQRVEGVVRTLLKLHSRRGIEISTDVPPELTARMQQEDLEEILGNLLENASRFAKERIVVAGEHVGARVVVTVDDDGPGLDPSQRRQVLERGVRLDEASKGWGLGLAIVRDLAELYGGSIRLEESPAGGLRGRLTLPGA
jgi:signal transduction histidine kinase